MGFEFIVFNIVILLFSVVVHEVAHGYVAEHLGDPTARNAGRLTLNPMKHLDPVGSVLLPILFAILPGNFMFGWAKPVPYDPRNLRRPERDSALIAIAGPVSNLALAVAFGIVARVVPLAGLAPDQAIMFQMLVGSVVLINVTLAIFNLVPLPPLDGSKAILLLFPRAAATLEHFYARYGFVAFLVFLFFGIEFIHPLIVGLYRLIL